MVGLTASQGQCELVHTVVAQLRVFSQMEEWEMS
jgi:hypothetical protein